MCHNLWLPAILSSHSFVFVSTPLAMTVFKMEIDPTTSHPSRVEGDRPKTKQAESRDEEALSRVVRLGSNAAVGGVSLPANLLPAHPSTEASVTGDQSNYEDDILHL